MGLTEPLFPHMQLAVKLLQTWEDGSKDGKKIAKQLGWRIAGDPGQNRVEEKGMDPRVNWTVVAACTRARMHEKVRQVQKALYDNWITEDELPTLNPVMWESMNLPAELFAHMVLAVKLLQNYEEGARGDRVAVDLGWKIGFRKDSSKARNVSRPTR
jgi:hypothetical protein